MGLNRFSRERFSSAIPDEAGTLYLSDPEPFGYVELPDTIVHKVSGGDTWWTLAAKYYPSFPNPSQLWYLIADFQPSPPVDPTIKLVPGSTVYVPSARTVDEDILNETRRATLG